jgi:hypothetical protein
MKKSPKIPEIAVISPGSLKTMKRIPTVSYTIAE